MIRSFGPIVTKDRDTGEYRACCSHRAGFCDMLRGCETEGWRCTYGKEPRPIRNPKETPDFCEMRSGMIEDAKEMDDFARFKLDRKSRPDLLEIAKGIPTEFRPKPLHKVSKFALQRAIRQAMLAQEKTA